MIAAPPVISPHRGASAQLLFVKTDGALNV